MQRRSKLLVAGLGLGVVLFVASAIGISVSHSRDDSTAVAVPGGPTDDLGRISGASLDEMIAGLQGHLEATPNDDVSWATLGLAYVQQAKATVNPDYYPKAEGALQRSLEVRPGDNYLAAAGLSSLASARHDFEAAKSFADEGLAINPYSAILWGALSDAELQLGRYPEAFAAVQKMIDLRPDTSSLSRASYTWELRGDTDRARELMQRALDDAPTPADRAFADFYLGELAFNAGDPNSALAHYRAALAVSPDDPAALSGKAKAEAALGQIETAIDDYELLVSRTPEPSYILEYGEFLESLGRTADAERQYDVFAATQILFEANGVEPDATPTLFLANHGDAVEALADAETGVATRPFLVMHDAHAWALHQNGRDDEALAAMAMAMSLETPNALFSYHRGMIRFSLGDLDGARADLTEALALNPFFNPLAVPIAQATLVDLGASG